MSKGTPKNVGILVGFEETFPQAFIEAVNRKGSGDVVCDYAKVGVTRDTAGRRYDVLVDRISHEIEMYKPWLKQEALNGSYVINDPFWWVADDKFFDNTLVAKLGVAVPRTVVLPSQTPHPRTTAKSYRNLALMDWDEIFDFIKFPLFMKPYDGGGWRHVYKCRNPNEVFDNYHQTEQLVMILQEAIEFDTYCRCLCIGKDTIIPVKYDPKAKETTGFGAYLDSDEFEAGKSALADRIIRDARVINHALNYDMNSVEFAIRDGVPYAIDFMNPAPDLDYYSITPKYFDRAVEAMSSFAVEIARSGQSLNTAHYPWRKVLENGGELPQAVKIAKEPAAAK